MKMYIADKYWNNYIGDTDDSMTLVEYLADRQKEEISLGEIFSKGFYFGDVRFFFVHGETDSNT